MSTLKGPLIMANIDCTLNPKSCVQGLVWQMVWQIVLLFKRFVAQAR